MGKWGIDRYIMRTVYCSRVKLKSEGAEIFLALRDLGDPFQF